MAAAAKQAEAEAEEAPPARSSRSKQPPPDESMAEKIVNNPAFKNLLRSAATVAGREISRSIFGTRKR